MWKKRISSLLLLILFGFVLPSQAAPFFGRCALKNLANAKYSRSDANKKIVATRRGIGSRELFFIAKSGAQHVTIQCSATGLYLRVLANAPHTVEASAESTESKATKFVQNDLGGGIYAFKSLANGQCLRVANDGTFVLRADGGTSADSDAEKFRIDGCQIDMWKALTAFARNYPDKVKVKSSENPPAQARLTAEKMNGETHYWHHVFEDFRFDPIGHPVYDRNVVRYVGDWECWVITGTLPQFQAGMNWLEGIPRTRRYCDATIQEDSPHQNVKWREIAMDCSEKQVTSGDEWGRRYVGQMQNLGVGRGNSQIDMGNRWVIRTGYKDSEESWVIDLGPKVGVFDPQYGTVAYVTGDGVFLWFNNVQNAYDVNPKRCATY